MSRTRRHWRYQHYTAQERRDAYAWLRALGLSRAEAAKLRDWPPQRVRRLGYSNFPLTSREQRDLYGT